ncbi:MAG: CotH kinase family protein [Gemmataceae bacterium]
MTRSLALAALLGLTQTLFAQPPGGPGGPGGGFGGPPGGQSQKLIEKFDKNGDGRLNSEERAAARKFLQENQNGRGGGFGGRGRGGPPGGFGGGEASPSPGPHMNPGDATTYPDKSLFDTSTLRTIFLEFENKKDWEKELEEFHGSDVDVPCTMIVDGKSYPEVGVHFRGMSSYFTVRAGSKRSLNLSLDHSGSKQRLYGAKSLNLLNGHDMTSFMDTVLYSQISSPHIPTPKANFVKVVINGEYWGVYTSVQQFDKEFLKENYKTDKGTRWKVRGNPGARGGLEYFGDNVEDYKRVFEMKGKDDPKAWKAFVNLCKVLNTTPADKLEEALSPILDIDSLLWFLAIDVAVINCDGYWIRSSDYSIYLDDKGKFHIVPHDMNECFRAPSGPGMGGGPGGPGGMFMMPKPGELVPAPLQMMLDVSDEQKKKLEALQKETDAKLEKIMSSEQRKQWQDMKNNPMGFGPPGGMGPGGSGRGQLAGGRGPGGPGGMMGGSAPKINGNTPVGLDPLTGLDSARTPLRSKVLAVPAWRKTYLQHIYTIANEQFDWKKVGPVIAQYRKLIDESVKADTRKLYSYEAFVSSTADTPPSPGTRSREMSLRQFMDQRRDYLINHPDVKKAIEK